MEYCPGGSLENHIQTNGLPPHEFEEFFTQFMNGWEHLTKLNITHRDLKPENILVSGIGNDQRFKISDFGAARVLKKDQRYSSLHGTAEYLHPDVYPHCHFYRDEIENFPKREFKAEHEIWAGAVTLYHAATGILPFDPAKGRADPKTMYHMLSSKKPHHISATETKHGVVFHERLPRSCALTGSVKKNLEALFVGMLKVGIFVKLSSFDQFFHRTTLQ